MPEDTHDMDIDWDRFWRRFEEAIPNWAYWRSRDLWELHEAVLLAMRQNPTPRALEGLLSFRKVGLHEPASDAQKLLVYAEDAIRTGDLPAKVDNDGCYVHPGAFLKWFQKQGALLPRWFELWGDNLVPKRLRGIPAPPEQGEEGQGNYISRQVAITRYLETMEIELAALNPGNAAGKRIDRAIQRNQVIARSSGKGREIETTSLDAFILKARRKADATNPMDADILKARERKPNETPLPTM